MDLLAKSKAEMDLEELLSAAWTAQLAQLRGAANSDEPQARPDLEEKTRKEGDAR